MTECNFSRARHAATIALLISPRDTRVMAGLLLPGLLAGMLWVMPVMAQRPAPTNGFRHVALDAGHGIKTQGAISARGIAEFDFNRQLVAGIDTAFNAAGVRTTGVATAKCLRLRAGQSWPSQNTNLASAGMPN